jgi:hypothetical protein
MIADQRKSVERAVWIYLICMSLLMLMAWIPFLAHGPKQHNFPLSSFYERFGDLAHFANAHQKLAAPNLEDDDHLAGTMFPKNYGPLAVLVYLFLLKVCSPYGIVVFLLMVVSALAVGAFLLWRAARRSPGYRPFMCLAIFVTVFFALPTAETVLRGNVEGLLWIGYAAGIGYMFVRKWSKAAAVLAIASCIKPYPIFLFVILLWRRKYKQVVVGVFTFLITAIGCLTVVGAGNPVHGAARIRGGGEFFFDNYIVGFRDVHEAAQDHSLFETSKSIYRVVKAPSFHHLRAQDYEKQVSVHAGYILLPIYIVFAAFFVLWIVLRIRHQPFLNQIFSLSLCLTLFPLIAGDYTLTILYLPMGLFLLFLLRDVATGRAILSQGRLFSILIPCAWLMAPLPFLGIWAGDARSIVLLFLLLVVINTPMPMAIDLDEQQDYGGEMIEVRRASAV